MSKAKTADAKTCIVRTPDPNYCGIGAGGVQFANGQAIIPDGWVANWYRDKGYTVDPAPDEVANTSKGEKDTPPGGNPDEIK